MTGKRWVPEPAIRAHVGKHLYYAYAVDGTLLYIGQSHEVETRIYAHDAQHGWFWAYVASLVIVGPLQWDYTLAHEAAEIRALRPVFNRHHNPDPQQWTPAYRNLRRPRLIAWVPGSARVLVAR